MCRACPKLRAEIANAEQQRDAYALAHDEMRRQRDELKAQAQVATVDVRGMPEVVAVIDEAEAALATMREALEMAKQIRALDEMNYPMIRAALASDAGRSTLERIKRLERVALAADLFRANDKEAIPYVALCDALDALEAQDSAEAEAK